MKPEDITLDLHASTQYATAYVGDQPIASVARRPYHNTTGPAWTATGVFGEENGKEIARVSPNLNEETAAEMLKLRLARHYANRFCVGSITEQL